MAKRFKLRFSKVFNSCRSKDSSTLPIVPVPSFLRLSPVKRNPITLHLPPAATPSSKPQYSSIKRHVSSAFTSISCGFRSRSSVHHENRTESESPPPDHFFHWEKQEKWHVVNKLYSEEDDEETPRRKIYNSSASGHTSDAVLSLPPLKPKRRTRKKKTRPRIRVSTSSADSALFSSESFADDEDNEALTETLVSSFESFSTDSSPHFKNQAKVKSLKRRRFKPRKSFVGSSFSPARLSLFQGLIPCVVEGKVRESFAVVKKSEDPHEDFKRSMMEMILEKQMFEEKDLEQLLHCFLSLNSRDHHGVIIQAFYEIWEALFCNRRSTSRVSS